MLRFHVFSVFLLAFLQFNDASLFSEREELTMQDFLFWMKYYEKSYTTQELKAKFETFLDNHRLVRELNRVYADKTVFELNHFADMSPNEFKSKILMRNTKPPGKHPEHKYIKSDGNVNIPDSFDWRDHNAVTPVKDQGSVGTCWAFSTVQNIEGQWALKVNKLTNLSVEQVVDCDATKDLQNDHADCGVYGGWPYLSFQYVQRAGGIVAEANYSYCAGLKDSCQPCEAPGYNKTACGPPIPYCLLKDSCQAKLNTSQFVPNLKVIDWKAISENETDIAQQLINIGPLSVALNAQLLQFYHHGVFDPIKCDPTNLDHAVLMVGYGTSKSRIWGTQSYWLIKNSWGPKWGENGYFRILRGKGKCGINTQVATAVLA